MLYRWRALSSGFIYSLLPMFVFWKKKKKDYEVCRLLRHVCLVLLCLPFRWTIFLTKFIYLKMNEAFRLMKPLPGVVAASILCYKNTCIIWFFFKGEVNNRKDWNKNLIVCPFSQREIRWDQILLKWITF